MVGIPCCSNCTVDHGCHPRFGVQGLDHQDGYVSYALGKRDHTSLYEVSQVGPFNRWPSGEGFQHTYTFMAPDVHQFVPVMWNEHSPESYRKNYHLDRDLAGRAIKWITGHKSIKPDLPFRS